MAFTSVKGLLEGYAAQMDKEFWEYILEEDMHAQQITREQSLAYMRRVWQVMRQTVAHYDAAQRSRSGLSGGEKQRISIARSLLKHASVLLADEATAALDAQTAHQVTDDILSLTGVTRIVVTHTLEQAALRRYDGILVLKNGRIAESGTFDALMAQKGYFYALYTVSQ